MSSNPYRYELIKLADKLNKDYYPLTEVLCRNARIQAEWLQEQNEIASYLRFCDELDNMITRHLATSKSVLAGLRSDRSHESIIAFNSDEFRDSQKAIENTLHIIKNEIATKKITLWKEMHENLYMKLKVLNNLLTELFRIENDDLIPLLEKNKLV